MFQSNVFRVCVYVRLLQEAFFRLLVCLALTHTLKRWYVWTRAKKCQRTFLFHHFTLSKNGKNPTYVWSCVYLVLKSFPFYLLNIMYTCCLCSPILGKLLLFLCVSRCVYEGYRIWCSFMYFCEERKCFLVIFSVSIVLPCV